MTTTVTDQLWLAGWREWRAARNAAVLAPHGIAANAGTTWLSDVPQVIGGLPGTWIVRNGAAHDNANGLVLAPGEERLILGRLARVIAPRPGTVAVRVLDPAAPSREGLIGVDVFAPDPAWVVTGRFEAAVPGSTIAITHVDGVTTDDRLAGTVHVELAGTQLHLAAWPSPGAVGYEFTFTDATNGTSTQQFRFLEFAPPASGGTVELDFNRAFLPPCAFSAGYLCPIPPAQNRLPFPVDAGERFPRRDAVTGVSPVVTDRRG